ncbi:carboxypeptidase-like regulatory domain-containing protein [Winogradskyella ludwigii]|uniref:carboxypeptidase-like regulatory domain-containing protein n=1 Tax=Winogradskyella ludwigii TaxID=2686076 RepID=UPI0015CEC449|nr:carboxypeptidase-like regulatory domain-containing protein [Winogradskyella ludwigii]
MKKMTLFTVALCLSFITTAQMLITGIVTNDSIPLESASVIIKNSTTGIATNTNGEFKIEAKKGDTLSVSYLGYETKELVVNKKEKFEIKLEDDSHLDEVVVVAYNSRYRCCTTSCGICITSLTYWETELEKNKLFPNPSSNGIFQLKLTENYNKVEVVIANISGRIIQNSTYQKFGEIGSIDLSQFSKGIYIVNIIADGKLMESIKAIKG